MAAYAGRNLMERRVIGRDWKPRQNLKYEAQLHPEFGEQIASMPGCEKIHQCIQCGTCSATCPLSTYMDYTPRRIVAMTRAGFKDEVLGCFTIWLCASCYACTVDCPKQIKITDIMYALKQRAIRDGVYPKGFLIPALAASFFEAICKTGKSTESVIITKMYLKTNPLKMIAQAPLGMKLFSKGRMGVIPSKVKGNGYGPKDIQKLMAAVDRIQKAGPRATAARKEAH